MADCPSCGASTESEWLECPACGAVLEGATESFPPVGGAREPGSAERGDVPALVVRKGPVTGEIFYVDRDRITIGRDPDRDIFLSDITVSRHHATVCVDAGVVSVEDAGSLNGTYVNGVRVDQAPLRNGDTVQVGRFAMSFLGGGAPR